jgi:tRNA A-37 threonylcarbamoyl transferase component Bud32
MSTHDLPRREQPEMPPDVPALAEALHLALDREAHGEPVRVDGLLPAGAAGADRLAGALHVAGLLDRFVRHVEGESGIHVVPAGMTSTGAYGAGVETLPQPFPGEYHLRALLGEGSFGRVWLADDLHLGIPVALKALRPRGGVEQQSRALTALQNEARTLARLKHPNIVQVHGWRQAGADHYLVLQYVPGKSLEARLKEQGPLGWQPAARYIADVGEALLYVHAHGIVHCDVKLANLLWDRERDEALLTDFGLATRLADGGQVAGTPLYMAPEAFSGQRTPAGDVYGLAVSLFTLATGNVPFPGPTLAELGEQIRRGLPDPEPRCAGMPEPLERLVRSGLAVAPERRPELGAFVADLRGTLNRLLADTLLLPGATTEPAAPVQLRLTVARRQGDGTYVPLATTHPRPCGLTRNITKVPPAPERVGLRTGDRVRLEVSADREGFLTVFNVGPTGHLNLLYPDPGSPEVTAPPLPANQPLHVTEVAMTPPAGTERLFAVWSRVPLPLEQALTLTQGGQGPVSASYRATRNMERVQESVQRLWRGDWHAVVLELDHQN